MEIKKHTSKEVEAHIRKKAIEREGMNRNKNISQTSY